MKFQPFRRSWHLVFLTVALLGQDFHVHGQTPEQTGAATAEEVVRRAEWLKSIGASAATQQPKSQSAETFLKKRFVESRGMGIRLNETPATGTTPTGKPAEESPKPGSAAKASRIAETQPPEAAPKTAHPSEAKPAVVTNGKPANVKPAATSAASVASAKPASGSHPDDLHATATPSPKASPAPANAANIASTKPAAASHPSDLHGAASPSPKPSPTPASIASTASAKRAAATPPAKASPTPASTANVASAKPTPHPNAPATPSPKSNLLATQSESVTSAKLNLEPRLAGMRTMSTPYPSWRLSNQRPESFSNRYPWKTGIVTTVFWVGEPTTANNPTPNRASSWDTNWTQSYGGYDNPHPEARRNFMPVSFIPRQNPFYVALPYNDVTHGNTKPEARLVIPWFRESYRKEGQSVCRDRWVAIRGRDGRVAFAQWSDCGPFRTDHWQYVFGMERPKPNLNGGAGLDVSPAVRDYLALQSTDITDWRFVEAREVPHGPWTLYGDNNPLARYRTRTNQAAAYPSGAATLEVAANRNRPF